MTDAELIEGYLEHLRWRNRAQTTIDIRRTYLTHLSTLGAFAKIKPKALQAWMADPVRNLQASSQGTYLAAYHSFFLWAQKAGHLKKDPTIRIEKPAAKKGEPHPIADADLAKALANADPLMKCWLSLGAFAGCRCCEIATISRADVYLDTMQLYLAHTKGDKPRWLSLNPLVLEALAAWGMPESGRLWQLTAPQMSKAIGAYLHAMDARRVDGKPATAHALRHWFGTALWQSTLDILLVRDAMGHSSVATTQGYAMSDTSKQAGSVGALGRGL